MRISLIVTIHAGPTRARHRFNGAQSCLLTNIACYLKFVCTFLNLVDDDDDGAVVNFFVFGSALAMSMHILGKADQHMPMIVLHERQTTD